MSEPKLLTVVLTDFTDVSSHDGIPFNKDSVQSYIDSPEFKETLKNRHLLGLLTHGGRSDLTGEIPEVDHILKHKDFCNVITDTWIEGNKWLADVQLVDTDAADRLVQAIQSGVKCGVSIVVDIDRSTMDSYLIQKLYGVDFTLDPSFVSAQIVKKNFSRNKRRSIHVYCKQFSFKSYERDSKKNAAELINFRVREVTNALRSDGKKDYYLIRDYVFEPVYKWLRSAFRKEGTVNVSLALRLNRWVSSDILTRFNSEFNRIKRVYEKTGFISPADQKRISPIYAEIVYALMDFLKGRSGVKFSKNETPSQYLNGIISSLYAYMYEGEITQEGLQQRLDLVIRKREEEGLDYLTLFDDERLEEFVYQFLHTDNETERKGWYEAILSYLDDLIKVEEVL